MTEPIDRARLEAHADWLERRTAEATNLGYEPDDEDVEGYRQFAAALRTVMAWMDKAREPLETYLVMMRQAGWDTAGIAQVEDLLARLPAKEKTP